MGGSVDRLERLAALIESREDFELFTGDGLERWRQLYMAGGKARTARLAKDHEWGRWHADAKRDLAGGRHKDDERSGLVIGIPMGGAGSADGSAGGRVLQGTERRELRAFADEGLEAGVLDFRRALVSARWYRRRGDYDALDAALRQLQVEKPAVYREVKAVLIGRGEPIEFVVPTSSWVPAELDKTAGEREPVPVIPAAVNVDAQDAEDPDAFERHARAVLGVPSAKKSSASYANDTFPVEIMTRGATIKGYKLPLNSERFGRSPIDLLDPVDRRLLEEIAAYMPARIRVPDFVWENFTKRANDQRAANLSVRKHGTTEAFKARDMDFAQMMLADYLGFPELARLTRLDAKTLRKKPLLARLAEIKNLVRDLGILVAIDEGRSTALIADELWCSQKTVGRVRDAGRPLLANWEDLAASLLVLEKLQPGIMVVLMRSQQRRLTKAAA
jgi:hypothetical protein